MDWKGTLEFFWKHMKEYFNDSSVFDIIKMSILFLTALFLWTSVTIIIIKLL